MRARPRVGQAFKKRFELLVHSRVHTEFLISIGSLPNQEYKICLNFVGKMASCHVRRKVTLVAVLLVGSAVVCCGNIADELESGYFDREYSLTKPYAGAAVRSRRT